MKQQVAHEFRIGPALHGMARVPVRPFWPSLRITPSFVFGSQVARSSLCLLPFVQMADQAAWASVPTHPANKTGGGAHIDPAHAGDAAKVEAAVEAAQKKAWEALNAQKTGGSPAVPGAQPHNETQASDGVMVRANALCVFVYTSVYCSRLWRCDLALTLAGAHIEI